MPTGALVDPAVAMPEILTADEAKELTALLAIMRSNEDRATAGMITWLIHQATEKPGLNSEAVIKNCVYQFLCDDENEQPVYSKGILAGGIVRPLFLLAEAEYESLAAFVAVLRMDSWVSRWLMLQIHTIANAYHPAERCPTPLQLMSALTLDAEEFEAAAETTRQVLRARPDLFAGIMPAVPTPAPEPPATPTRSMISQSELGVFVRVEECLREVREGFLERIAEGEALEPGPLTASILANEPAAPLKRAEAAPPKRKRKKAA